MRKSIACLTLSVALSACSDSGSSGSAEPTNGVVNTSTNSDDITEATIANDDSDGAQNIVGASVDSSTLVSQFGRVIVENYISVDLSASFFKFSQPLEYSVILAQFNPALDSCEVTRLELAGERPDNGDLFANLMVEPISAGEVLTISSPAGSYAELLKNDQFGIVFYAVEEEDTLSIPAPADLSISIPGDEFATFSNVAFPSIVELQVNSPSNFDLVTPTTSFSWVPSPIPDTIIEIDAFSISADLTQTISITCTARDDGEFTFPASTQSQMGSSFAGRSSISRNAVEIFQSGSSVLAVVSSTEN